MIDESMFADATINVRLWSTQYGWGRVSCLGEVTITMSFETHDGLAFIVYDKRGVILHKGNMPYPQSLFWDEVKIEAPERPWRNKCHEGIHVYRIPAERVKDGVVVPRGECECKTSTPKACEHERVTRSSTWTDVCKDCGAELPEEEKCLHLKIIPITSDPLNIRPRLVCADCGEEPKGIDIRAVFIPCKACDRLDGFVRRTGEGPEDNDIAWCMDQHHTCGKEA